MDALSRGLLSFGIDLCRRAWRFIGNVVQEHADASKNDDWWAHK